MMAGVLVRMHMMSVEMLKRLAVHHCEAHLSLSLAHDFSTNRRFDNQPK